MSTKTIKILLAVLAGMLVCFFVLIAFTERSDGAQELYDNLHLSVANADVTFYQDNHGGFLGDGEAVAAFTASKKNAAFIEQNWRADFADEQVLGILFGEGGVLQSRGFSLPENGLFYFEDTGSEYSINFVFAVYDPATRAVYYCRFDT